MTNPPNPVNPVSTAASTADRPARKARASWVLLISVTVIGLAADLASKHLAFQLVAPKPVDVVRADVLALMEQDPLTIGRLVPSHAPVVVVPKMLNLTLVLNPGAVFGVGPGQRWFFKGFTVLALCFSGWMFWKWMRVRDWHAVASIGLLAAGGLGNLYDRLVYACVRDFLHPLPGVQWPAGLAPFGSREIWPYVSNVADAFLIVGIAVLFFFLWRHDGRRVA